MMKDSGRPGADAGVLLIALALGAAGQSGTPAPRTALDVKAEGSQTFYADPRVGNNQVTIFSQSTLEDFTVVCNQVGGQCAFDPRHVESLRGRFFLRVADLKSGIDLRDEHMRGPDWLDARNHPEITIEIASAQEAKKQSGDTAAMVLAGTCTIRGRTNPVRIPATIRYLDETPETMRRVKGDLIRIRAEFSIKLSDYGISGPAGGDTIGLKVADELEIRATVFGSTERPPDALRPDAPGASADVPVPPPPRKKDG